MSLDPLEAYNAGLHFKSESGSNNRMDFFIPTPVSFIFETDSLQHASPATVSRLAVILVSDLTREMQVKELQEFQEQNGQNGAKGCGAAIA